MESVGTRIINGHRIAYALHDTGSKTIVVFCHGYRSSSIGPNRFFVRTARKLAERGVSSFRFDQYGSGNSAGDFKTSSFYEWVKTTTEIVEAYRGQGFRVILFGQSMGGSTAIVAAADLPQLTAMVAWVPDASAEPFNEPESGIIEENGQIVQASYWREAHDARIGEKLRLVQAPAYIVQCSEDEYVSLMNHQTIVRNAQQHHTVRMFEGYKHSSWSYEQAGGIIDTSIDFILDILNA